MEKSPFYLTFNYNDKQIINKNFTITTELYYDKRTSINCENNQYRLCLVELSLQIQSDIMSIKFWCQPPAFLFEDFNQFSRFHTCILPIIDATQQPSITMIINSYDIGKIIPLTIANFTYLPEYYIEKNSEIPILIFNNENLLSRNVRYVVSENDDAIESELDDPDCIMEKINRTNGYSNQDDQSKDDEPDETAVPVDFASDIIPEDDRNQPIGEYDDSLAVNCTAGGPLYGHPNVEWIRVANASHFIIDQRINRNVDPDSDGIDFPKMDTYILQIRMIPYVFLQYVSVPASNVILLYVVVHYDSGRRHNAYHSKVEQSPVVENFLAKEPTRFFEVYLNATDDGLPPSDVTLDIGYCIAPKHKHPIIVDSDSSSDLLTGTIDVDANVGGSISSLVPKTIINPSVASDTLIPSQSQLDTVDVSINVAPVTQPIVVDEAHIPSINYEAQEPTSVRKPSDSLVETVDVSVSSSDSGYVPSETRGAEESSPSLQILSQVPVVQMVDNVDTSLAINNQDELNDMQVKSPALVATIDLSVSGDLSNKPYSTDAVSSPSLVFNGLLPMTTSQVPANYFCYNNLQIVGNINVQNIFHINSPQETPISDIVNSQSESTGYSFSSFHYPYHTIVINLRVNIYVHTLTLGPQSNVQRYGLRLYNPLRNVDDTYYSSIIPGSNNQPAIIGIPLAKVAIRLYLNLYTTSDGRPPSNIKIMINACFDLSSISSGSSPMIGGQYYRSPSISQIPTGIQQQPYYESPVDSGMSIPMMNVAQSSNINMHLKVNSIPSSSGPLETSDGRGVSPSLQVSYDTNVESMAVNNIAPSITMLVDASSNDPKNIAYDRSIGMQTPSPSLTESLDINVNMEVPAIPSSDSYYSSAVEQPRSPTVSYYSSLVLSQPSNVLNNLPSMTTSQVPASYFCYNNLQIVGNINVQNIFHINSPQQTPISDIINSQSKSTGYSFSSFHYPYHTIVINLRVNIYVHTLTLGPQSNVQRYGLRLYNPLRNVDDTYYSSIVPGSNNQPAIIGIPLAKVAIRLYLNLYTTNDGRPPSNIKIMINACFDLSSISSGSSPMIGGQYYRSPSISQIPTESQQQSYIGSYNAPALSGPGVSRENIVETVNIVGSIDSSVRTPYDESGSSSAQNNNAPDLIITTDSVDSGPIRSEPFIANVDVNVEISESSVPSMQMQYPNLPQTILTSAISHYYSPMLQSSSNVLNNLPSMTTSQVPANYFCYNNLQIVGNINVQNIFHINSPQETPVSDIINSQSESTGYSFSSFHYPYHTIVINLRVNIYVHTLTLGPQSNVQRYGLRLYNPLRNVDDTYYSSIIPGSNNQPAIAGIPLAKVAIRLYLNLYTTSDGRPPSNIKIMINACFDLSSISSGSSPMIGGQYYRSPSISQIPTGIQQQPYYESPVDSGMSMPTMDVAQSNNIVGAVDVSIIDSSLSTSNRVPSPPLIATIDISETVGRQPGSFGPMPSPNKPVPFSRTPGQCFDQILIIGGSHITMIRSRNPAHQVVGPEINFGGTGYTFSSPSDTYEFEVHFAQPFTMKYIFIPSSANVESFKVEASHAGMLGVFTSTNTKDGLVVDGFPTMLVSMLVITIIHTTDGYLPSHITLSIGVCNPIYSPSNEGNEAPEMTDCTPQLRLLGNPKQVTRVDIKTATMHIKPNNLINPNQDGMDFLTTEEYIIDIVLSRTMSIDSITLNPLTNVDSFKIQCHNSHGYYLEIKSIIGSKTINGLANTQANLIRIILLGTEDGNPPNHISIKIAACIPTSLPKIMRSPFKHELITKRRKPSKLNKNRFDVLEDQLTMTYTEQQVPISEEQFQLDSQSPTSVQLTANVDVQPIQEPDMDILPSPILAQPSSNIEYQPLINSQSQYIQNQIPERNIQSQTNIVVEIIQQPVIQTQSSPIILQVQEKILVSPMAKPTTSLPSYLTRSPSAYSCSHNYQITTSIHINSIYTLCGCTQSSIIDSTSSNSLSSNDGYSFSSHHYPFHTIVVSLKFTGYVQSLSLGSKSNIQRYGLRVFNPLRNVDDTYYSSIDPNTGQPIISNIHMAKVAIRLYINLYTTNDGRPPSNIQLNFNICFDLRSSSNGDRRFVTTEQPVIPSSILIPQRTAYVQQQPIVSPVAIEAVVLTISSPMISPIVRETVPTMLQETLVIQSQQPVLVPTRNQPVIERPVSPFATDTIYSSIVSMEQPTVHMLPSPIIETQVSVQITENTYPSRIVPSPSYVSTPTGPQLIQQSIIIERPSPSDRIPSVSVQVPTAQITGPGISSPSYLTRSPSAYTCSHNYQITTSVHINSIYTLCGCSQSSIIDSTSSNSLSSNDGYSFSSHHYPFHTIVVSLKFTGYVQSLSLGSKS
ncbi:unnamed protein product, partial [Rotaria sp. Silwood1]